MEQNETVAASETNTKPSEPFRHPNGQTDEQIRDMLAALGRRKNDPEYLERLFGAVEQVRRRLNEEYLREMAELIKPLKSEN